MSTDAATAAPTTRSEERFGAFGRVAGAPVVRLIVRRILIALPMLLAISILVFVLLELLPGDPARVQAGMDATPEQVEAVRQRLGLDRPAPERYVGWLLGALTGNFGVSTVQQKPVTEILANAIPPTIEIVGLAFVVSLAVALPIALLAARKPGGFFDRITMVISMALLAIPNYVLALLLVLVFAVAFRGMLPSLGYVPISQGLWPNLRTVILPVLALAIPLMAFYTRFLRGDLVEQIHSADYVDTARAKGVGPWKVLWGHAFRNSSFGLLTIVGLNIGGLIGATVIIEQIFSIRGLGMEMLQGLGSRDIAVVQMCVFIFAAVAITANLVVDILYAVLDPRVRHGRH